MEIPARLLQGGAVFPLPWALISFGVDLGKILISLLYQINTLVTFCSTKGNMEINRSYQCSSRTKTSKQYFREIKSK